MPRFFFSFLSDGSLAQDPEGTEAANLAEAKAIAIASTLLANQVKSGSDTALDAVMVTDESGTEVLTIHARDVLPKPLREGRPQRRRRG
jgi:hypothetical protein